MDEILEALAAVRAVVSPPPVDDRWQGFRRMVQSASMLAAAIGCVCAVYLCLRHSSDLSTVPWLPKFISNWADHHGRIRNVPAFFLLTWPFMFLFPVALWRVWAVLGLGGFGTLLELAQYFVPTRWVEWQDVMWSWTGVIIAWLLFEAVRGMLERVIVKLPCQQPS